MTKFPRFTLHSVPGVPVKIVHPNHVEIMGFGPVLLTSPSSAVADLDMGQITEEAALTSRAFAVIGKPIRDPDPDKSASQDQDLRNGIEGFLTEDGIRYILEIEGKIDAGVEVAKTRGGQTCSDSTFALVRSRLESQFTVKPNEFQEVHPDGLATSYSRKNEKGEFLVETVRVLFGSEERQFRKERVISVISEIADLLSGRVGSSLTD